MTAQWLRSQLAAVEKDSATWPTWKKREVDMPGYGTTDEIQELRRERDESDAKVNELSNDIESLQEALANMRADRDGAIDDCRLLRAKLGESDAKISELVSECVAMQNKIDELSGKK